MFKRKIERLLSENFADGVWLTRKRGTADVTEIIELILLRRFVLTTSKFCFNGKYIEEDDFREFSYVSC